MNIYPKSTKEEEKAPEDSPKQQPRQIENDWNTISPGPKARVSPSAEEHVASKTPAVEEAEEEEEEKEEKEQTFPQLLMDMVEQETEDGAMIDGARVLEWLESGTSFVIRDKKAFEKKVLPKYFHAKCKFVSFARKLHRWGFRQAQSRSRRNSAMGFIFIHTNFVRGDKNRCLKMRSIVKKPNQQQAVVVQPQQPFSGFAGGGQHFAGHNNLFQGLAGMNSQCGMDDRPPSAYPGMAAEPSHQYPQAPHYDNMYPSLNQGVDSIGPDVGGQSSGFNPNELPLLTSAEMFAVGLRLQRMEQRQQQMHFMGMPNNTGHAAAPPPSVAPSYNVPQPQHQPDGSSFNSSSNSANNPNNRIRSLSGDYSSSLGGTAPSEDTSSYNDPQSQTDGSSLNNSDYADPDNFTESLPEHFSLDRGGISTMSDLELASEIMMRNPGMEPWQALELASRT